MKIHLASSGGFANLRLEGALDTTDLPAELAAEVEEKLAAESIEGARQPTNRQMADGEIYELTVLPEDEDGEVRKYQLARDSTDPELMGLLGLLMREITKRKAAAAKKEK